MENNNEEQKNTIPDEKMSPAKKILAYVVGVFFLLAIIQGLFSGGESNSNQNTSHTTSNKKTFYGYECTSSDCGGHQAGWDWAESKGLDNPDDCGGKSESFIEGCLAYTLNN